MFSVNLHTLDFSYFWLAILLLAIAHSIYYVSKKARCQFTKVSYILAALGFSIWIVSSFYSSFGHGTGAVSLWLQSASSSWLHYFSLGLIVILGSQLLLTVCYPREIAELRYWVIQSNNLIVCFLSLSVVSASSEESASLVETYSLENYFIVSFLLSVFYVCYVIAQKYNSSLDEYFRFKVRSIFRYSFLSLLLTTIVVFSIPLIPSTASATIIAEVCGVSTAVGISRLIVDGPRLYLEYSLRLLLEQPYMQSDETINSACRIIDGVKNCLENDQGSVEIESVISLNSERKINDNDLVVLSSTDKKNSHSRDSAIYYSLLRGIEQNNQRLLDENARIRESICNFEKQKITGPDVFYDISSEQIDKFLERVTAKYGEQELVVASSEYISNVDQALKLSNSSSSIIFEGEKGSGRSTLAKLVHSARDAGPLRELNCLIRNDRSLLSELSRKTLKKFERQGLLIKNIETLDYRELSSLLPLLSEECSEEDLPIAYIYLSAETGFLAGSAAIDYYSYYPLRSHRINILPLRERRADLFNQFLYFSREISGELGKKMEGIDRKAFESLYSYGWPRNSQELRKVVKQTLANVQGSRIDNLIIDQPLAKLPDIYSLEDRRERIYLFHLLRVNHFDMDSVARELQINIEKLRELLERHSLEIPDHIKKIRQVSI